MQPLPGDALGALHQVFRRPFKNKLTARVAPFGTDIDHPVGAGNHVGVVLDHDDGVAKCRQTAQHPHQYGNVFKMKAGRGFVQYIKRASRIAPRQLLSKFDALRFTAREGHGALPQTDVAKPHFFEHFKLADDLRVNVEKGQCITHRHIQYIGN